MADAVQQIHCRYSPEEDRLLLEISSARRVAYRIWITRRCLKILWQGLFKSLESQPEVKVQPQRETKRAVMAFQKQEAVRTANFKDEYDKKDLNYPQGEVPILPKTLNFSPNQAGGTRLAFAAANGASVQLNLSSEQLYSFCHLLISVNTKTGWDLKLAIDQPPGAIADTPAHIH